MNEAAIQTALDAAAIFMQNRQERLDYLNREMAIMDYESDKDAWIEEGKNEGESNMLTAIKMIKENKPFAEISEKTGLTEQRLTELKSML